MSLLSIPARVWRGEASARTSVSAIAAIIIGFLSSTVTAQDDPTVELHAFDGSAVVKGELTEVSDGSYVLKTALGIFRIGLDEAECRGVACPTLEAFDADFSIQIASADMTPLVETLLSGYAANLGAESRINDTGDGRRAVEIVDDESGRRLASVDLQTRSASERDAASTDVDEGDLRVFLEPSLAEVDSLEDELLVAFDGVTVIAHPESPINVLSKREIAELFACLKTDVEGLNGPLRLYIPDDASNTSGTFRTMVLDAFGLEFCNAAVQLGSDADIAEAVLNDRNAVGVVGLGQEVDAKPIAVETCRIMHAPTFFNVKAGLYPLARSIYLDAPSLNESSAISQRFIDFALSDDGQERVEDMGYVGLNLETTRTNASEYLSVRLEAAINSVQNIQRVYQLIEETENAIQLSTTFYFKSGTTDVDDGPSLDNRAQRDLARLAKYVQSDVRNGSELLVFGFADASGDYDANLALSIQRAQSVADRLAILGLPISVVAGFGEEAPIACNSDSAGRAKNRRVEVWLRGPAEQANNSELIKTTM